MGNGVEWWNSEQNQYRKSQEDLPFFKERDIFVSKDQQHYYGQNFWLSQIDKNNYLRNGPKTYVENNKWKEQRIGEDPIDIENWNSWKKDKLERISDKPTLLQRVREKMWIDDLENTSASDFMKSFDKLKKDNKLMAFYVILQQDGTDILSKYIKNNLSLEQKVSVLEIVDNAVNRSDDTVDKRNPLVLKIFKPDNEKQWINKIVSSSCNLDEKQKVINIRKIEKYFRVNNIIKWLGYDRDAISKDDRIKKQTSNEVKKNPSLYTWTAGILNSEITRCFMLKLLDVSASSQVIVDKWIISIEKMNIIKKYAETWWCMIWLLQTISYMDENSQKKIWELNESWIRMFLDQLSKDPDLTQKIHNILWYSENENSANRAALLLISTASLMKTVDVIKGDLLENPDFLSSKEGLELQNRAIAGKENERIALQLYRQETKKQNSKLFIGLEESEINEKISQNWLKLLPEEREIYLTKAWNNNPNKKSELEFALASTVQRSAEASVRQETNEKWINYDQLTAEQQILRVNENVYGASRDFVSPYVTAERLWQIDNQLDAVRNQNNQELYQAANKYWFSEDLRQVRWEKYYQEVEQQYIASYDQKFGKVEKQYQNSSLWSHINNQVFANINTENQIFWNREIPRNVLNQWLTDEEYELYLNKIYPERTWDDSLYNDTNRIIKEEFKNRIIYFLWNCFDIKLDSKSQETLLKSFNFEEKKYWEKKDNWEISLTWKDTINGRKIKIYYNTETWSVNVGKWIDINNNWGSIDTDKKNENNLSFVIWPRIDDFYDKAKAISYSNILKNKDTKSYTDYSNQVSDQLKILAPLENQWNLAKEELNKNFLINIALQDVADVIWIRDLVEKGSEISLENKELFSLLSRSFSTYDKKQIDDFRGVLKFMINYNEEVLSKKNLDKKSPQYIDNQLDDLEKSVSNDNYKNAKEITKVLFEEIHKEKTSWSFSWAVLLDFLNSFLSDKEWFSWNKNSIIDTKKILTYYEDLSQENQTDQEVHYMTTLNNNMTPYLAEYWTDESLKSMNSNIA